MTKPVVSEQTFFVLLALTHQPLHGYAIVAEAATLSNDRIALPVGTLYGILDRLAASGAIEVDREEVVDSRLRRYYRLTGDGRRLLESEVARQHANARIARRRLATRIRPVLQTFLRFWPALLAKAS